MLLYNTIDSIEDIYDLSSDDGDTFFENNSMDIMRLFSTYCSMFEFEEGFHEIDEETQESIFYDSMAYFTVLHLIFCEDNDEITSIEEIDLPYPYSEDNDNLGNLLQSDFCDALSGCISLSATVEDLKRDGLVDVKIINGLAYYKITEKGKLYIN